MDVLRVLNTVLLPIAVLFLCALLAGWMLWLDDFHFLLFFA